MTYEEPIIVSNGDVEVGHPGEDPNLKMEFGAKKPTGLRSHPRRERPDLASVLQKTIAANNAQPIGARFLLLNSKCGYHIVPMQSHDVNGLLVEERSVLDFPVYVPVKARTHLAMKRLDIRG